MKLEELPQMDTEHQAWLDWHQEFTRLTGLDINDARCRSFVARTRIWGEENAKLRYLQDGRYCDNVIAEAKAML